MLIQLCRLVVFLVYINLLYFQYCTASGHKRKHIHRLTSPKKLGYSKCCFFFSLGAKNVIESCLYLNIGITLFQHLL